MKSGEMSKTNLTLDAVEAIVLERIAPLFAVDEGSLEVVEVNTETECIKVRFGGSFNGSPCREILFENVVKPILKEALGEFKALEWVD